MHNFNIPERDVFLFDKIQDCLFDRQDIAKMKAMSDTGEVIAVIFQLLHQEIKQHAALFFFIAIQEQLIVFAFNSEVRESLSDNRIDGIDIFLQRGLGDKELICQQVIIHIGFI